LCLTEGVRESEVIKQAIALAQNENSEPEYMLQVLMNLMVCVKHGNCELPIKNFK
jgi:CLIP-associating protein 1/2